MLQQEFVELLGEPGFWAAVGLLVGTLATSWWNARGKDKDQAWTALDGTVKNLQEQSKLLFSQVELLSARVESLEVDLLESRAEARKYERLLRASLEWVRSILAWGGEVMSLVEPDIDIELPPGVPDLLTDYY